MSVVEARRGGDRVLIALAIGGIGLSIVAAIVGSLGILPTPLVIVVVLGAVTVTLRFALVLRARRSSVLSDVRVMNVVSLCGLGLSGLAAVTTLGIALEGGGPLLLFEDLLLHAWSLALLLGAASPVRTLGWRAFAGVTSASLLASSALARAVGTPVVDALGMNNVLATSVWVPVSEELLKALPVAIIVLLAARSRVARPSVIDIALLGAFSGAGFTIFENAQFGRVWAAWDAASPFSLLFPSMGSGSGAGPWNAVAGHLVWTSLFCMGIGFGVLYFRRFRFAWIAIPASFLLVVLEHGISNALLPVPLGGVLSTLLLIGGFGVLVAFERLPLRGVSGLRAGILLTAETVDLRRSAFAASQRIAQSSTVTKEALR